MVGIHSGQNGMAIPFLLKFDGLISIKMPAHVLGGTSDHLWTFEQGPHLAWVKNRSAL